METFKLFFFACLTVALLGPIQSGTAVAFDGDDGGFDGGFDDGGDDGGEEVGDSDEPEDGGEQDDDQGEGRDRDKDGRNDAHGHHRHDRGHGHRHGHRHHGRGHHTHIIYGWPAFGFGAFGYTPSPYYAYPPGGFRRLAQPPVVHIERKDRSQPSPEPRTYWYYCRDPEGYYPDVEECPDGWEQVSSRAQEDNHE